MRVCGRRHLLQRHHLRASLGNAFEKNSSCLAPIERALTRFGRYEPAYISALEIALMATPVFLNSLQAEHPIEVTRGYLLLMQNINARVSVK